MKLMTQTASMTNHLYSRMTKGQPEPEHDMGATIMCWTDRHAATIINVTKLATTVIWVREDKAKRTDKNGLSESQSYDYAPDPAGRLYTFRQRADGSWEQVVVNAKTGRLNKVEGGGHGLRIGSRDHYHDFSF